MAQMVKNLGVMQETWARSLGWEDPLERGTAIHYPLKYFGLEHSMDCIVHRVAKSWTRVSDSLFTLQKVAAASFHPFEPEVVLGRNCLE